jgi:hypothetical protein
VARRSSKGSFGRRKQHYLRRENILTRSRLDTWPLGVKSTLGFLVKQKSIGSSGSSGAMQRLPSTSRAALRRPMDGKSRRRIWLQSRPFRRTSPGAGSILYGILPETISLGAFRSSLKGVQLWTCPQEALTVIGEYEYLDNVSKLLIFAPLRSVFYSVAKLMLYSCNDQPLEKAYPNPTLVFVQS